MVPIIGYGAAFVAHESNALGTQVLGLSRHAANRRAVQLRGGDPCAPSKSVIVLPVSALSAVRGEYFRLVGPEARERKPDHPLHGWIASFPWTRPAAHLLIVNPRILDDRGMICEKSIEGFCDALRSACGYSAPAVAAARKLRRKEREKERRKENQEEKGYLPQPYALP